MVILAVEIKVVILKFVGFQIRKIERSGYPMHCVLNEIEVPKYGWRNYTD
jgi:hypothetical protein